MRTLCARFLTRIALVLAIFAVFLSSSVDATDLESQRQLYQRAKSALADSRVSVFQDLKESLQDYPLYPYLLYNEALKRLSSLTPEEATTLKEQLTGSVLADQFYQRWVDTQALRKRWKIYVDHFDFESTDDAEKQCKYLRALFRLGFEDKALSMVPELWTVGISQPDECNPIFAVWINRGHLTSEVAWTRMQLAVEEESTTLARYLLRFFPRNELPTARLLYDVYRNASIVRNVNRFPNDSRGRWVWSYGLQKYARDHATKAFDLWKKYKDEFEFSPELAKNTEDELVFWFARDGGVLAEINPNYSFTTIEEIVDAAVAQREWKTAFDWLDTVEETNRLSYKWRYWYAKCSWELGYAYAHTLFAELAEERTYYGFLAAQEIGVPISINALDHEKLAEQEAQFLSDVRIARVLELYAMGEDEHAKEEWSWLLPRLKDADARNWMPYKIGQIGHPNHAIQAAVSADASDLVYTRFPLLYINEFERHTEQTNTELPVLLALTRQESWFNPRAVSPVGAHGLMQLMPSTARRTARNIRVPQPNLAGLKYAPTNIQIGTYHFRELLDEFNNNRVLALTAYNAGPNRVKRWIKGAEGMDTLAWIEMIPYYETRNYVKNVLSFTQVYGYLLDSPLPVLEEHEKTIPSRG